MKTTEEIEREAHITEDMTVEQIDCWISDQREVISDMEGALADLETKTHAATSTTRRRIDAIHQAVHALQQKRFNFEEAMRLAEQLERVSVQRGLVRALRDEPEDVPSRGPGG